MKIKDLQIRKMEETIHGLDLRMKDKDLKNKNLQDKVFDYLTISKNIQFVPNRSLFMVLINLIFPGERTGVTATH